MDDAIFYLWEHRREIEITYSVRAYLMRAVRNRCLNELQSLSHREELHFSSFMLPENMEFLDSVFVEENQPLGVLLEQELEDELTRSIEELPVECRTVFKKSRFEQKKWKMQKVFQNLLPKNWTACYNSDNSGFIRSARLFSRGTTQ